MTIAPLADLERKNKERGENGGKRHFWMGSTFGCYCPRGRRPLRRLGTMMSFVSRRRFGAPARDLDPRAPGFTSAE